MVTEDFVSFEIAKLLKEKGFDGLCTAYYDCFTTENFHCGNEPTDFNSIDTKIRNIVAAPTHQMAMKWLREVHKVEIYPYHYSLVENPYWWFEIIKFPNTVASYESYEKYSSYEEACEAAIRYTLENLI